ncbi:M48 family metallopeptidase [Marinoscillum furvescens]|uniref:Peptidase M48-like protein n=1 Tax=Marinoscillum furvescens DSM 4134 TaxID=1122208 RepID=A0A3D9L7J6_MARFU|nr:M48 family metallopeptidase [Marinoscillum furvescens]REE01280.1 peptidase M48-like protein [Marinoscillum furvescens DSM 4134]
MKNSKSLYAVTLIMLTLLAGCTSSGKVSSLLFSPSDDRALGKQVSEEIAANPQEYPLLSEAQYPAAYRYLNAMRDRILASNDVDYLKEFAWELKIIRDDDMLNAFATPGGYIYVYTGLIKYLDNADDLAGVMGHEIAHADRRHSIKQLEKRYGINLLLSIALGQDPSQLAQIAAQLAGTGAILKFSRDAEEEADEYSVKYLADTEYACNGAATFFAKLLNEGKAGGTPEFLSTHPSPKSRVSDINELASKINCETALTNETGMTYADFIAALP